jgi:hypothetical protein
MSSFELECKLFFATLLYGVMSNVLLVQVMEGQRLVGFSLTLVTTF